MKLLHLEIQSGIVKISGSKSGAMALNVRFNLTLSNVTKLHYTFFDSVRMSDTVPSLICGARLAGVDSTGIHSY